MRPRITLTLLAAAAALAPLAPVSAGPASAAERPACRGTHQVMLYVVNQARFLVTPARAATGTVLKDIKTQPSPTAIAATPNGKMVYVVNTGEDGYPEGHTVTPVRTATSTALKPIKLLIR